MKFEVDIDAAMSAGGAVLVVRELQRGGRGHPDAARGAERAGPGHAGLQPGAVVRVLRRHLRPSAQLRTLQHAAGQNH